MLLASLCTLYCTVPALPFHGTHKVLGHTGLYISHVMCRCNKYIPKLMWKNSSCGKSWCRVVRMGFSAHIFLFFVESVTCSSVL
jgi:hypothetical protein